MSDDAPDTGSLTGDFDAIVERPPATTTT